MRFPQPKKMFAFFLALFVFLIQSPVLKAQVVGANAYIKATSVEVGLSGAGGFEGSDVTMFPPPAGMHHRSSGMGANYFGFVANPQLNAWAGSAFDGDFFTPGAPENGWGFEIGNTGGPSGSNNCVAGTLQIPGSITNWSHIATCYNADWEGNYTSGTNLHFKINYFIQETDLYYTTTVSITNNTTDTIRDLYYYRNVDPDNNQSIDGFFETTNKIVSEPGSGCNLAHVSATQVGSSNSYLGFAAIGSQWRASYGGFSNRDASDLWNGLGFTQTVGASVYMDEAIALSYKILKLAPNATETFKFVVILSDSSATNAINNLLYFTYPGAAGAPSAVCAAVAGDTVATCGSPVPINVSGSNVTDYTWTWTPAAGLSSTTGPSVIANPGTSTTYTVNGTPISSCVPPVTMSVVVEVTPGAGVNPVIAAVPPLCIGGGSVTLTADSSGGTWSGTGITNPATGTFDPAVAGIGSTIITYTTPGLCNSSDTILITVSNIADASIAAVPPICISGSAVSLTSATGGGTWSGTGITNPSTGTFDPATAGLGSHVITYTISGTCADVDSVTVNVTSIFDATITTPAAVCQNSSPFNMTAATGGGTWSGTSITNPASGTFSPTIAGTQTVIYTIPGSCGAADTINVNVLTAPDVTIAPVPPMCLTNSPINLTADSAGGTWSGPGIINPTAGTFSPAAAGLGGHIVTYTTTNGICTTIDTVIVWVNTFSDATIAQPLAMCITASVDTLSAVTFGGVWSGSGITNSSLGTFDPAVAGVGPHIISYSISGSCPDFDTVLVQVDSIFDVTISQPLNQCFGSTAVNLTAAYPGGIWTGSGITDAVNGTFTPAVTGAHLITYTVSGSCGNVDTVIVNVVPAADASITAANAVCAGSAAFGLTAATPGGVWSGTGITSSSAGTFDPTVSGSGTFVVTYSIGGACGDTATQNVTVHAIPAPTITADVTSGCTPVCVQFTAGTSPLCNYVHYDFGDGDTSNLSSPSHCFNASGVYTVAITCTDMNGCVGTTVDSGMVTAYAVPTAGFSIMPLDTFPVNAPVHFVNSSTAETSAYWNFGDGSPYNNSTEYWSPKHPYTTPGEYCITLIATNAAGCADTATNCVTIYDPMLMIPNVFTPNGDGINDEWRVTGEGITQFTCAIYDRWGLKVAEWNNINDGWNGTSANGSPAPDGTYYYMLTATTINGYAMQHQGYIQLLNH